MLTESEIKAYTVDIPNDIQAALRASGSLQQDGWAIRGKRWNVEKEMMEYFRSPPEPHTFTEETARHMHAAMTELHSGWEWEIISPNTDIRDRAT